MRNDNHVHPLRRNGGAGKIASPLLVGLLLALLLAACVPGSREPLSDSERAQRLENHLEQLAQDDRFAGTVLLARDGVPIFARAYGMANRETQTHNDVETVYRLASVSKMFAAVAIGQLASDNKLRLDDPIGAYLPDYPVEVANKVSIHQLLTHSSGIPDFFFADPQRHSAVKDSRNPHRDFIPVIADKPLNFEPGTTFEYSNSNFLLLGAIVERVSGQNYYDYVRQHIFEPAAMHETVWAPEDVPVERLALGYTGIGPDGRPRRGERAVVDRDWIGPEGYNPEPVIGGAYGGGYATASDLLKFFTALRQHILLDERTTTLLLTDRIDGFEDHRYAYGFDVYPAHGQWAVGHGGGAPGVSNHVYMYPGGYDLIILSNYDNSIDSRTMSRLNALLMR